LLRELVVPLAVGLLSLALLLSTVALAVELARDLRSGRGVCCAGCRGSFPVLGSYPGHLDRIQ
jgi:hypothetical protein